MSWWQIILVTLTGAFSLSILIAVYWNGKTKYIEAKPTGLFENRAHRKEPNGS